MISRKQILAFGILGGTLTACDPTSNLGSGFEIVDGGGSRFSLAKDGFIIINYTVTGVGRVDQYLIIEAKDYSAEQCEYYVISPATRDLVPVGDAERYGTKVSFRQVLEAVEPLSSRSCKTQNQ